MSRPGVVASGHPETSAAAAEVLRAGGNAFDAAVAAGFAAAVAEPALTSLGGGGFALARTADGSATLFDFFVDTPGRGLPDSSLAPHFVPVTVRFPASEQEFNVGLGSVAVPGNAQGYLHLHRRLGHLPLADVIAPAVALARDGVELSPRQAYFLELLEPIMTLTETGQAIYRPDGRYVRAGRSLRQPELADFIAGLPDSAHELYAGGIAQRVERDMRDGAGLLTAADLAAFEVVERAPLRAPYRGFELLTNPAPSFGGILVALTLALLEAEEPAAQGFHSPEHLTGLLGVMQEVDRRRTEAIAAAGTTHVSVVDGEGNAASMTTSNGEGSGYFAPGTGVMLNNMLGEDDLHPEGFHASPPGRRVASMMAPSLLLEGGALRVVVGSGGSKRIRTALAQVLSNVADFGMSLDEAVRAPRLHWDGSCAQVEPGVSEPALEGLRARAPLNVWPVQDLYFGGVHAVAPDGDAAGDARRGGAVRVVEP